MRHVLLTFFVLIAPATALAHGDKPSLEVETGGYLIDIGYDHEGIRPGEEVTFDFDLLTTDNHPAYVPFQSINVYVTQGSGTVLRESIVNGRQYVPTLPVTFDAAGDYQMQVAYIQSGATIAQSTFDLHVKPTAGTVARAENAIHYIAAALLLTFTLIYGIISYIRRPRKGSSKVLKP